LPKAPLSPAKGLNFMRIDAHQHFWRLAERVGEWPPAELEAIYRDFAPKDLKPLLDDAGIDGTVLVQTMEREADTAFMLDLADRHDFILGVVGWTDLKAADAPDAIARLAAHQKLKGLRPMLQGLSDDRWITDPALDPAIAAMVSADLAFDALVFPKHLPHLIVFADRHPDLRIVIDHGAKPPIAEGRFVEWRAAMADLAALPNVSCKLSGLLTEAGNQRPQAVRPYGETILDLFGADGVIWGSDWPVVRLAGDYRSWFDQCRDMVSNDHHTAVFGGNAIDFYRLNR
jgi:L-fuconolactonase